MCANVCACVCLRLDVCRCVRAPAMTRLHGPLAPHGSGGQPEAGWASPLLAVRTEPGAPGREPFSSSWCRFLPRGPLCTAQRLRRGCDGAVGCSAAAEAGPGRRPGPRGGARRPQRGTPSCAQRSPAHTELRAWRPCGPALHRLGVDAGPGRGATVGSPPPLPGLAAPLPVSPPPTASLGPSSEEARRRPSRDRPSRPPGPAVCCQTGVGAVRGGAGPACPSTRRRGLPSGHRSGLVCGQWGHGPGRASAPWTCSTRHAVPRLLALPAGHVSFQKPAAEALADTDSLDPHSNPSARSCESPRFTKDAAETQNGATSSQLGARDPGSGGQADRAPSPAHSHVRFRAAIHPEMAGWRGFLDPVPLQPDHRALLPLRTQPGPGPPWTSNFAP